MTERDPSNSLAEAVEEFNRHEQREDGARVVGCLLGGLTLLQRSMYDRVHIDVEREIGADSMTKPLSEMKASRRTTREIEAFQIAESAAAARELSYVGGTDEWYLQWLSALRLEGRRLDIEIRQQCLDYLAKSADARRLAFSDALGRVLPESRRAPLVLFRLLPMAVRIVTASAFSDRTTAAGLRQQQVAILPAIIDCHECQGRVLECGEACPACGNPLWKYRWLTAVD